MRPLIFGDVINHTAMHYPRVVLPLGVVGILNMSDLPITIKFLHCYALQRLTLCFILTGIDQSLNFAVVDFLDDDMLLRLHFGVALYFIINHVVI